MVHRIYSAKLQLNKANASDTEAAFLDLNLSIDNDIVSTKIYDKWDDFDFVNFPLLDCDGPRRTFYGVYILTYRNNPTYISMILLIFLSVRSNTDQILMK